MKETVDKMKREPPEWEKIFANNISDKRLLSKIKTKKVMQFNLKTIKKKKAEDLNSIISKRQINGQQILTNLN